MPESFLEPGAAVEEQAEAQAGPTENTQTAAGPETLAVSSDEFAALEERIRRTVTLVKHERQTRAEAEERATSAEAQLRAQTPVVDQLESDVKSLRAERDQVKERVERLLHELDALEL
jgi:chromosome segregation ATPase